jgi:hypothetical protein
MGLSASSHRERHVPAWRARFAPVVALAFLVVVPSRASIAQPADTSPPAATAPTAQAGAQAPPLSLARCADTAEAAQAPYTPFDPHRGLMYRLTETHLRLRIGRGVHVAGGLTPTTNIAAQAGSLDPTIHAMAATSVNLDGSTPFNRPKARVERVRSAAAYTTCR